METAIKSAYSDSPQMIIIAPNQRPPLLVQLESLKTSKQVTQYLIVLSLANQMAKMVHPDQNYLTAASYYPLIEEEIFTRAALDNVLLPQLSKSEAFLA
ncbi:MAG TPA: hypothetical protein VJZ49_14450 [Syntrophales bacterium]|nr:hypothetical protein [Syntrophales bacterium]